MGDCSDWLKNAQSWAIGEPGVAVSPAAISLQCLPKLHLFTIAHPDNRCGVKAHANLKSGGQTLMRRTTSELAPGGARQVACRRASGVTAMLYKVALHLRAVNLRRSGGLAEHGSPLTVEVNQFLRHRLPLG
jgi:hypothetical protein